MSNEQNLLIKPMSSTGKNNTIWFIDMMDDYFILLV
jgi:hypothetical protein